MLYPLLLLLSHVLYSYLAVTNELCLTSKNNIGNSAIVLQITGLQTNF